MHVTSHRRRGLSAAPLLVLSTLALICSSARPAWANGRPPGTTGLAVPPAAAHSPVQLLGLTYGLAVAREAAGPFHWVCEEAIGGPTGVDALIAAADGNTLITGSSRGLYVSYDGGCDWVAEPTFAPPNQVGALALDSKSAKAWWVALNVPEAGRGYLYRTRDGGHSYAKMPHSWPNLFIYSLATAANDPNLLVLAGSNNAAHDSLLVYTSHNAGVTWHGGSIAHAPPASATPIVAVSPHDAKVMVVAALDVSSNSTMALTSRDGGASWKQSGHVAEPVRNIVFGDDPNLVWLSGTGRLYGSRDGGTSFSPLPGPLTNACATWHHGALWACGSSAAGKDGYALAQSRDGGQSFAPALAQLGDIRGPDACPETSSTRRLCAPLWANQQAVVAAAIHFNPDSEFVASAPAATTAGANEEKGAVAAAPSPAPANPSGCHCSTGGNAGGTLTALAGLAVWMRTRRRRSHNPSV